MRRDSSSHNASQLFRHRVRPNRDETIHLVEITNDDLAADPSLVRNALACHFLAADRHWRKTDTSPGYDDKAVDSHILDSCMAASAETRQEAYKRLTHALNSGRSKFFLCVATKGNRQKVVGVAALTNWEKHEDSQYHHRGTQVSWLYVLPGYERLGLGQRMLTAVENYARSIGIETLYLESTVHADEFYKKLGYHPSMPDDPRMDNSGSAIMGTMMYKHLGPQQDIPARPRTYKGRGR